MLLGEQVASGGGCGRGSMKKHLTLIFSGKKYEYLTFQTKKYIYLFFPEKHVYYFFWQKTLNTWTSDWKNTYHNFWSEKY